MGIGRGNNICSIKAWEAFKDVHLARTMKHYLEVFVEENRPLTHVEASALVQAKFGYKPKARNGRIADLTDRGYLEHFDHAISSESKQQVTTWKYTGRTVSKVQVERMVVCPCGHGEIPGKVWIEEHEVRDTDVLVRAKKPKIKDEDEYGIERS